MKSISDKDIKRTALCVDLDGTLIYTDMLLESICALLNQKPFLIFLVPFWLLRGRAFLKMKLSSNVHINPATLPYNQELLEYLKEQKKRGRELVLATATNIQLAQKIADHLGIFDLVLGSDGSTNRAGSKKMHQLKERFKTYDYIGNEWRDRKIWSNAENSLIVTTSKRLVYLLSREITFKHIFLREQHLISNILKALRVHQWVKNILLFVPLFLAHQFESIDLFTKSLFAFISFCFCASAFYVFNDLTDLSADRMHPIKKNRPFASGDLSIGTGVILVPLLLGISVLFALNVEPGFFYALICYAVLTGLYSSFLKRIVVLDVVVLASFYAIRLFAGALAVNLEISTWLMAFSMFIFLSLAFAKRHSELYAMRERKQKEASGRGYLANDLEQVSQLGTASGYISVLVMALYVSSDEVTALYTSPKLLWLICPLLLYWIGRVWILTHRGKLDEDPILFALKDKPSYLVGILAIIVTFVAI